MAQAACQRTSRARTGVTRVLAPAVVAAVLLAACTGGDHGTAPSVRQATGDVAIDPHHPAPAVPIRGAARGGTVTVLSSVTGLGLPTSLDPTDAYLGLVTPSILSSLVTRSLTQYVYDPHRETMVLVPDLATDTGRPNPDFTSWTFTIRSGVRFENGTEVTAADVAYGIKRSLDRKDFPLGAPYSTQYFLDGDTYHGPALSGRCRGTSHLTRTLPGPGREGASRMTRPSSRTRETPTRMSRRISRQSTRSLSSGSSR